MNGSKTLTEEDVAVDSREGKRARQIKAQVTDLMEEVVEVMEQARKEGFEIQFSIVRNQEGANVIGILQVVKAW